ncbi:hypothetical protein [Urechidicola sp. KH5]
MDSSGELQSVTSTSSIYLLSFHSSASKASFSSSTITIFNMVGWFLFLILCYAIYTIYNHLQKMACLYLTKSNRCETLFPLLSETVILCSPIDAYSSF